MEGQHQQYWKAEIAFALLKCYIPAYITGTESYKKAIFTLQNEFLLKYSLLFCYLGLKMRWGREERIVGFRNPARIYCQS